MNGTIKYHFIFDIDIDLGGGAGLDGALFIDADMDGTHDDMIILTALDAAGDFALGDIIA